MFPILYTSNTSKEDFERNGLGFIRSAVKCDVTEERNGAYELEAEILGSDRLFGNVLPGNFIKAKANPHDPPQIFEIYSISRTHDKVTVKAQHNRYIFFNNFITEPTGSLEAHPQMGTWTPSQWWEYVSGGEGHANLLAIDPLWDFSTNITSNGFVSAAAECPVRLGDFFVGAEGSMVDTFGGELHCDNFRVELFARRGRDTGVCLRYGSGISSYAQTSDSTTIYSHLAPFARVHAQDQQTGEERPDMWVFLPSVIPIGAGYAYNRVLSYDFSNDFSDDVLLLSGTTPTNYAELRRKLESLAMAYIGRNLSALTEPSVHITVDVESALNELQDIKLTDTVLVRFDGGISTRAKVTRVEYDSLLERYTKIELGSIKKNIADLFSGKNIGGA